MLRTYLRFRERKGQTMAEYALIMAAIAVAAYAAYAGFGDELSELVASVTSTF